MFSIHTPSNALVIFLCFYAAFSFLFACSTHWRQSIKPKGIYVEDDNPYHNSSIQPRFPCFSLILILELIKARNTTTVSLFIINNRLIWLKKLSSTAWTRYTTSAEVLVVVTVLSKNICTNLPKTFFQVFLILVPLHILLVRRHCFYLPYAWMSKKALDFQGWCTYPSLVLKNLVRKYIIIQDWKL